MRTVGLKRSDAFHQEVHSLELMITAFLSTLPPLHQLDTAGSEDKPTLIAVHTLAHTAMIHLYQRFAPDDLVSYDKCAHAARACSTVITHITDPDFAFLDPILGVRSRLAFFAIPTDISSSALLDLGR